MRRINSIGRHNFFYSEEEETIFWSLQTLKMKESLDGPSINPNQVEEGPLMVKFSPLIMCLFLLFSFLKIINIHWRIWGIEITA